MELIVDRKTHTTDATQGTLSIDTGLNMQHICYTLEDARRATGVKIRGDTCIPAGRYRVGVSYSARFKRDMPMIYNCADLITLKNEGISFTGIRIHGGNTHKNTEGCLLVAYNIVNDTTIQGTAETEVTTLIKTALDFGEEVWIEFL